MSWNPLNRAKLMQQQAMEARAAEEAKKAALLASNPKPPRAPSGPMPDVSKGIGFGTRRTVMGKGKGKRKHKTLKRRSRK